MLLTCGQISGIHFDYIELCSEREGETDNWEKKYVLF